jgi:hypothetical protein
VLYTFSAASWGIADQYPEDGVNEPWSPWGWHATTRRFRTWYRHENVIQGKHDPMNGGEVSYMYMHMCFIRTLMSFSWIVRLPTSTCRRIRTQNLASRSTQVKTFLRFISFYTRFPFRTDFVIVFRFLLLQLMALKRVRIGQVKVLSSYQVVVQV